MLFYWKNEREISCLPSILDPQIKKLDFAPYEIEQTLNSLKNKYRKIKLSLDSLDESRLWNVARLLGLSQTLKCKLERGVANFLDEPELWNKWIMIQTTLVCGYWILSLDFVIGLIEHRFLDNNTNCKLSG
ncbi:hypothetical protein RhiirA1_536511 [Rhizophagus irregularis]|uniref:Uncharacterized protein n=1 Tax=Rhizophagus irregularis TaxID=588596 RepID=A0A2N0RPG5_9GLOM|nr:hypothetical protein RhiirA1_536511 [Rhizophagus irregularis]